MKEALLVVDVQRCFLNDFTRHIPERVAKLIAGGDYEPLYFTRFVNIDGSPYRRLLDWHECEGEPDTLLAPEIEGLAGRGRVFVKEGFTGLPDQLTECLREEGIERLAIVGIDTDMCVLKTAIDVFDLGLEPVVLADCCASTAGLQAHLAGLGIISRNIGPHQIRETGLGGGTLAAPEDRRPESQPAS